MGRDKWDNQTNDEMYDLASNYLKESLLKCVEEVKKIDMNDTLYEWKLSQPVYINNQIKNTIYDHTIIANGIVQILKVLESPIAT